MQNPSLSENIQGSDWNICWSNESPSRRTENFGNRFQPGINRKDYWEQELKTEREAEKSSRAYCNNIRQKRQDTGSHKEREVEVNQPLKKSIIFLKKGSSHLTPRIGKKPRKCSETVIAKGFNSYFESRLESSENLVNPCVCPNDKLISGQNVLKREKTLFSSQILSKEQPSNSHNNVKEIFTVQKFIRLSSLKGNQGMARCLSPKQALDQAKKQKVKYSLISPRLGKQISTKRQPDLIQLLETDQTYLFQSCASDSKLPKMTIENPQQISVDLQSKEFDESQINLQNIELLRELENIYGKLPSASLPRIKQRFRILPSCFCNQKEMGENEDENLLSSMQKKGNQLDVYKWLKIASAKNLKMKLTSKSHRKG